MQLCSVAHFSVIKIRIGAISYTAVCTAEVSDAREITQYVKCRLLFLFLEVKEAVEVIEASDVIRIVEVIEATEVFRTTQILKINNIVARITLFRCFEKKIFFE